MTVKIEKNILLVEDDRGIRLSLMDVLLDEGYTVHGVGNGQEALDFLAAPTFEVGLILLDSMMPVLDGFGFRREQIKNEVFAQIPTLLYSADPTTRQRAEAIGLPFFKKPFQLGIFLDAIAHYFPDGEGAKVRRPFIKEA